MSVRNLLILAAAVVAAIVGCEEGSSSRVTQPTQSQTQQEGKIGFRVVISPGQLTNFCSTVAGYSFDINWRASGTTTKSGGGYGTWYGKDAEFHFTISGLTSGSNYVVSIDGEAHIADSHTCKGKICSFDLPSTTITTMPGGGAIVVNPGLTTELAPVTLVVSNPRLCQ